MKHALCRLALVLAVAMLSAISESAPPSPIALPGDRLFPENITASRDGMLYVGSLGTGGVIRVNPKSGDAQVWIAPGAFGSQAILGVYADDRSHTLWACSNDLSANTSALTGFDLATGKGKISVPLPGTATFCNDMTVGGDGSVYVTDSKNPQILKLAPGSKQLEVFASSPEWQPAPGQYALDGIAFGTDGNLYVDTFTAAQIFRVAVQAGRGGKITQLTSPRQLMLTDAMRPFGKNLFLIIEGTGSLDRIKIDGDAFSVETLQDGFVGPTAVAQIGNTGWVIEGQLSFLDPTKKGQGPRLPFRIYPVSLSAKP